MFILKAGNCDLGARHIIATISSLIDPDTDYSSLSTILSHILVPDLIDACRSLFESNPLPPADWNIIHSEIRVKT